jgi:hypothetical protein
MIMFFAYQVKLNKYFAAMLIVILLGVHPHLLMLLLVIYLLLKSRKPSYPKGTKKLLKSSIVKESDEQTRPVAMYSKSMEPKEGVDFVVLGSDLGSMYTAALLARCGRKVMVIEDSKMNQAHGGENSTDGDVIEHGCLVRFDGLDFVIGDQTLPGGSQGQLYVDQLATALPSSSSSSSSSSSYASKWVRLGGANGIHSVLSINKGEPLLFGSGIEQVASLWKSNGVNVSLAGPMASKLHEACSVLTYAQKLPPKKMSDASILDKFNQRLKKKVLFICLFFVLFFFARACIYCIEVYIVLYFYFFHSYISICT